MIRHLNRELKIPAEVLIA
jgi:hypothetical protein